MNRWGFTLMGLTFAAAAALAQETPVFKSPNDKISYGIGVSVGRNFKQQGIEIDTDYLFKGIQDALSGGRLQLSEADLRTTMSAFQQELMRNQAKAKKVAEIDNKKEGDAFMTQNKSKEGVVALPSGLQYKVLKAGEGKRPGDADTVEARYRGTLLNGTEFDSTDPNGPPASFKLSEVIPGWREALKLMPVGSKWQLFVPPELAYSTRGAGLYIGPNATLIFELELLGIAEDTVAQ